MSGSGGNKHDGPLASVHRLDPDRPKRRRSLPKAPAAPNEETPAPDRNAALSMLGTFDLDDVDFRSPDEILATLAPEPTVSEPDDPPQASPADERAITRDIPAVEDVQSDEILRELEEHHQRGQTTARPSAPRGSAELQPALRRKVPPARKREVRGRGLWRIEAPRRAQPARAFPCRGRGVHGHRKRCDAVSAGRHGQPPADLRSVEQPGRDDWVHARADQPFETAANAIAKEDRQLTRRVKSPVRHHRRVATVRKRSTRHHLVTHATVAPAASTSPATSSASYSGSSSVTTSSSQPATTTAAAATSSNTSHQSQPAFGLNGSLGPGRGAPGTQ